MKYAVKATTRFKKSVKLMEKRGKSRAKLLEVVNKLAMGETLLPQNRDHALTGNLVGFRDCHIENDWVLIYKIQNDVLILTLADTGTHSDLGL
jgi:mRNA interferase YafQ